MTDTADNLFEAVQVYTIAGTTPQYLMIVGGVGRCGKILPILYRDQSRGSWTPLAATESNPFAGKNNITFPNGKHLDGRTSATVI